MPTPKAIFYDLDGTLRHHHPAGRDVFAQQAGRLGLQILPQDLLRSARWEHAYWAGSDDLRADIQRFDNDDTAFWQNYSRRLLLSLGCPEIRAADLAPSLSAYMNDHYQPQDLLFEDAILTLTGLRQRGYILAVVSNREKPFDEYLRQKGISEHFDFALAAGQVESWKPNPEIFLHAARRAGIDPRDALYIGDNYYADIVGARRAGMQAVLFDPGSVFPEADCPVIQSHAQIFDVLERM
jgi:HAD superfamily hydrolase (TIGR01509 family)